MIKVTGKSLISLAVLGVAGVLIYKTIRNTLTFIGPKSSSAFIICGLLFAAGIYLSLKNKKKTN